MEIFVNSTKLVISSLCIIYIQFIRIPVVIFNKKDSLSNKKVNRPWSQFELASNHHQ